MTGKTLLRLGHSTALAVAAAVSMLAAPSAHAELVACAGPDHSVEVALARWERKRFVARGWFAVPKDSCRVLIGRALHKGKYYYFARSRSGKAVWPAQSAEFRAICVNPSRDFALREWSSLGPRCPAGFEQRRFGARVPAGGRLRIHFDGSR
jgi:uncharacterized membrane protein